MYFISLTHWVGKTTARSSLSQPCVWGWARQQLLPELCNSVVRGRWHWWTSELLFFHPHRNKAPSAPHPHVQPVGSWEVVCCQEALRHTNTHTHKHRHSANNTHVAKHTDCTVRSDVAHTAAHINTNSFYVIVNSTGSPICSFSPSDQDWSLTHRHNTGLPLSWPLDPDLLQLLSPLTLSSLTCGPTLEVGHSDLSL